MSAPRETSAGQPVVRGVLLCAAGLSLYLAAFGLAWSRTTLRDREANSDPLRALVSPLPTAVFTVSFWTREADGHTALWRRALAQCAGPATGTNCSHVATAQVLVRLREDAP